MTTRSNSTFRERLPYCDCDLCKCHHGFQLNVGKSEETRRESPVYMSPKKWVEIVSSIPYSSNLPPLSSRSTPGAVLGTPWEWKGYSQTTTDRTKYSEKQQQHKKTTRYSDKPSDRQTYASNGSGSNGASLLETVATFIKPVTLQFFANLFIKKIVNIYNKAGLLVSFWLQELICNLVAGQACGILTGKVWKTITL